MVVVFLLYLPIPTSGLVVSSAPTNSPKEVIAAAAFVREQKA